MPGAPQSSTSPLRRLRLRSLRSTQPAPNLGANSGKGLFREPLIMMYLFDRLCKCELFTFLILQPVAGNDMGGPFQAFQK